ncbi:hypothetical protein predicted by Glimmer/Critica [Bdellovibrio bacteriovorus HD100]|uniref:Uncharacterized protein n=2 Tax=Bdellovibrio bacteriovorus TaxID=959 RepID=Q6MMN3_BDEBA|nr:hypothetical protein predicted by Glimmer/Critica [Bdellovibrio bacteriovorus HD100]
MSEGTADKFGMRSVFGVVFLFLMQAQAFEISKQSGKLILSGACEEGKSIYSSLARWSTNAKTGKTCDPVAVAGESGGSCNLDITDCVPEHVVKYHGARPEVDGPNCWNLSLVMSKILPAMRYSTPEEMNFYMRPPLCRALKDGEKKEPGDVGAIRQIAGFNKTEEYHGFIYIDEKIAYSKNGFSNMAPYELQTLDKVYRTYEVPDKPGCRQNVINSKSSQCGQAVAFYRCDSMDEYLEKNKNVPDQVRESFKNMDAAENCVQEALFKGDTLSVEARKNLRDTGLALVEYLQSAKSKPEVAKMKAEERDFLLGSLQLRLAALGDQLEFVAMERQDGEAFKASGELKYVAEMLQASAKQLKKGARK